MPEGKLVAAVKDGAEWAYLAATGPASAVAAARISSGSMSSTPKARPGEEGGGKCGTEKADVTGCNA